MNFNILRTIISLIGAAIIMASIDNCAYAASSSFTMDIQKGTLVIHNADMELPVSLKGPVIVFDSNKRLGGEMPVGYKGDLPSGKVVEIAIKPFDIEGGGKFESKVMLQWSPSEKVLRKWLSYKITGLDTQPVVKEIILDEYDKSAGMRQSYNAVPQSYPVFANGFFVGIEYPVASTRIQDGNAIIAHKPGNIVIPGEWYQSRKAVYGIAAKGKERAGFEKYISFHEPHVKNLHIDYNSWWTTGIPYNEKDIINLLDVFKTKLYDPYGISFDTFCVDMGWSDPHSIWKISKDLFPDGFARINEIAQKMDSHLGVWVSPISAYPPALDNNWAKDQGYKTFPIMLGTEPYRLICATDENYREELGKNLSEMITKYGVRMVKFDNYRLQCPETDHGHQPGDLAAEPMADAIIDIIARLRAACPDVWIESNGFGAYQSPWWQFHVSTLLSDLGADAPYGYIPCPVYRESYTTARDHFNLRGDRLNMVDEINLHVCGFVHQTPEPFMNDLIMSILRGSMFLPLYVNPDYMDDNRWKALAETLKWAKENQSIIRNTYPIDPISVINGNAARLPLESPVPREPYGYAHWNKDKGLIAIRNPWIAPCVYELKLDSSIGIPEKLSGLSAKSIYPEPRVYGENLKSDDMLRIPLAPYETILLTVDKSSSNSEAFRIEDVKKDLISSRIDSLDIKKVKFTGPNANTIDSQYLVPDSDSALKISMNADITIDAPKADLLILLEHKDIPVDPICSITVDGKPAGISISGSDTGWAADLSRSDYTNEQWLFLKAGLHNGVNKVAIDMLNRSDAPRVSAWVWAYKDGSHASRTVLPEPELISLDAECLLEPVSIDSSGLDTIAMSRPFEKINGVFLDALDLSALEGNVKKNRSINDKPLLIFGRTYQRGLGMNVPAKVSIDLNHEYSRFSALVGEDANGELWDDSIVSFEVLLDGKSVWRSKPIVRNMAPEKVDIDIKGGEKLELVTIRSGNSKTAAREFNLADWVDASLIR